MTAPDTPTIAPLAVALSAVGDLIDGIRDEQWSVPTPCTNWTVRDVVPHLVGMNLVFAALLREEAPPDRGLDRLGNDPLGAYRESGSSLLAAFSQPGVLERSYHGPLGSATGAERAQIRLYDLLAHGWDLSRATGQPCLLPDGLAARALAFARVQLSAQPRAGRFDDAHAISENAPAIDRLAAFLGRSVPMS